ncbi:MAG: hypothetical protein V7L21_13260 [Nostoc sp.]|uniref:hypothetical protein n=1 Tax=Nostoc sp. NMS9 TaxID=2815393 RepID=UPI0025F953B7|nr:hypothetical protein [Nostoc sp. NMS9]MBN3940677.1 hypothetical protein [Nostoc sp. NMS9]
MTSNCLTVKICELSGSGLSGVGSGWSGWSSSDGGGNCGGGEGEGGWTAVAGVAEAKESCFGVVVR